MGGRLKGLCGCINKLGVLGTGRALGPAGPRLGSESLGVDIRWVLR